MTRSGVDTPGRDRPRSPVASRAPGAVAARGPDLPDSARTLPRLQIVQVVTAASRTALRGDPSPHTAPSLRDALRAPLTRPPRRGVGRYRGNGGGAGSWPGRAQKGGQTGSSTDNQDQGAVQVRRAEFGSSLWIPNSATSGRAPLRAPAEDLGRLAVWLRNELGVDAQSGGTPAAVAEPAGDGA